MKKIMQTKFGKEEGNCFNACVASLFELELGKIPYYANEENWLDQFNNWLFKKMGIILVAIRLDENGYLPSHLKNSFLIVGGESERGLQHAVIYKNNKLIHDPHFSGTGIKSIEDYYLPVKIMQ